MAIFLRYQKMYEDELGVEYDLTRSMEDPDPERIRFAKDDSAEVPRTLVTSMILSRVHREGVWPAGGLKQS